MRFLFRSAWLWPIIILLLTAAASLVILVPEVIATSAVELLRPSLVMAFLFICPGMAIVRFFRLCEMVAELVLGVTLSFIIGAFVAGIILYANRWSPVLIFDILLGFCLAGAVAQLLLAFARWFIALRSTQQERQAHAKGA
jgi:hypothetical protein